MAHEKMAWPQEAASNGAPTVAFLLRGMVGARYCAFAAQVPLTAGDARASVMQYSGQRRA